MGVAGALIAVAGVGVFGERRGLSFARLPSVGSRTLAQLGPRTLLDRPCLPYEREAGAKFRVEGREAGSAVRTLGPVSASSPPAGTVPTTGWSGPARAALADAPPDALSYCSNPSTRMRALATATIRDRSRRSRAAIGRGRMFLVRTSTPCAPATPTDAPRPIPTRAGGERRSPGGLARKRRRRHCGGNHADPGRAAEAAGVAGGEARAWSSRTDEIRRPRHPLTCARRWRPTALRFPSTEAGRRLGDGPRCGRRSAGVEGERHLRVKVDGERVLDEVAGRSPTLGRRGRRAAFLAQTSFQAVSPSSRSHLHASVIRPRPREGPVLD